MKVYSPEMRRDVLAACQSGEGTRAVALRFRVSESWVRRVKQEFRESGKVGPARTRRCVPKWVAEADRIRRAIADQRHLTLAQLKARLGTNLSVPTVCRALKALQLTYKKRS
jgi:transposase